jgi:hypothetical protein
MMMKLYAQTMRLHAFIVMLSKNLVVQKNAENQKKVLVVVIYVNGLNLQLNSMIVFAYMIMIVIMKA